jgi:hypothetical protein
MRKAALKIINESFGPPLLKDQKYEDLAVSNGMHYKDLAKLLRLESQEEVKALCELHGICTKEFPDVCHAAASEAGITRYNF